MGRGGPLASYLGLVIFQLCLCQTSKKADTPTSRQFILRQKQAVIGQKSQSGGMRINKSSCHRHQTIMYSIALRFPEDHHEQGLLIYSAQTKCLGATNSAGVFDSCSPDDSAGSELAQKRDGHMNSLNDRQELPYRSEQGTRRPQARAIVPLQ